MRNFLVTLAAASSVALSTVVMSTAAVAVTVADGKYDGTSDDGNSVELVVGTNPDTGNQGIIGANVFFSAPCKGLGTGLTLNTGWGWGPNSDLTGNKAAFDTTGDYFDIKIAATFKFDGTVTGTIDSRSPSLVPNPADRPNRAMYCEASFQHFSLSYTGSADKVPPAKGSMVLITKQK